MSSTNNKKIEQKTKELGKRSGSNMLGVMVWKLCGFRHDFLPKVAARYFDKAMATDSYR